MLQSSPLGPNAGTRLDAARGCACPSAVLAADCARRTYECQAILRTPDMELTNKCHIPSVGETLLRKCWPNSISWHGFSSRAGLRTDQSAGSGVAALRFDFLGREMRVFCVPHRSRMTGNAAASLGMQTIIALLRRIRRSLADSVRKSMLAAIKKLVRARFADVPHLTTAQLAQWLADAQRSPPLLLDVRTEAEYAVSHLRDAQQIDPDSSVDDVMSTLPNDRPWVLYCSVGYRSSHLAQRLLQAGATEVSNLDGAIFSWIREGRELHTDGPARVHPYSKIAAKLLRPEHRAPLPC